MSFFGTVITTLVHRMLQLSAISAKKLFLVFTHNDLNSKFSRVSLRNRTTFIETYLIDDILGKIENNKLTLTGIT